MRLMNNGGSPSRKADMDKKFGYYVLLGLLIGAVYGAGLDTSNGNIFLGLWIGVLIGVFIGWFFAIADVHQDR